MAVPPEAEQWYLQASAFAARGQQRDAVRALTHALELAPDFVLAYVDRGLILSKAGLAEQALADFTQALRLDSNCGPAYQGRGWVRHLQGDYQGAIEDTQRALALDPDNAPMYQRQIGAAYHSMRQYDQAIAGYTAIIDAHPQDIGTLYDRALCYADMGQNNRALADLACVLEISPGWPWALKLRATIYTRLKQYKLAYADVAAAGQRDQRFRQQRVYLWLMAHPIRSLAGLVAFLAFILFLVITFTAPRVASDTVVEISGPFASIALGERETLVLRLAGYPGPFLIWSADRPLFDEPGFRAAVRPGDKLYLSVFKKDIQDVQAGRQLAVFQIRSERAVYLSLDATAELRRHDSLIIVPLGVLGSLLVLVLTVGPLLRSPWRR